jgi:archaeal type IV pilus assembly protein PilA
MSSIRTFNKDNERRGVAPIIATLLMVAIAVVGGILIFVFAQGFFSNSQVEGPAIESVMLLGYDARDVETGLLQSAAGSSLLGQDSADGSDNRISPDDEVAFYFKNTGTRDLVINTFKIAGETYTFTPTTPLAADNPDSGEYAIVDGNSNSTLGITTLPAGAETTIVASIIDSPLKTGRSYGVEITTGNGAIFKFDFIAGINKG